MRFIVIKQATDLEALRGKLLKRGASEATLARIQTMNPHADLKRLKPGSVLLLPDLPEVDDKASESVTGDAFQTLSDEITRGLSAASKRVREATAKLDAEHDAVSAAVKTAAVKRAVTADPALKDQLAAASAEFNEDKKRAQRTEAELGELKKRASEELSALSRLLR